MLLRVIGILIFLGAMILFWFMKDILPGVLSAVEIYVLASTAGSLIFIALLPLVETLWGYELRAACRKRFEDLRGSSRPSVLGGIIQFVLERINGWLAPIYQRGLGRILLSLWCDAGYRSEPLPITIVLFVILGLGGQLSYLAAESKLLSVFITLLLLGGFSTFLFSRAKIHRQLFHDQFPGVLDRLADSLQAGYSLSQAIGFFAPNLSEPSASEMNLINTQFQIGFSVEQALMALYQRRPTEDVLLLVEGVQLQRQVGGNMVEMIREIAGMIRERVELENQIRTMTAQGRLSAVVIALLVPVSLGLLSFFPGYTDVLFKSTIGNLVLIAAGFLELIGGFLVMRLIRIEV